MVASSIAQLRLASQQLIGEGSQAPSEVVRFMLAMQAQDYPGAKWSVGLRSPGSTEASVDAAIERREIVRSWPLRGTLHFTAAEDLGWMLDLTNPRMASTAARRRAQLGLDDKTVGKAHEAVSAVLEGGAPLTRTELLEVMARADVTIDKQRGYHLLWNLACAKVHCFGPNRGKEHTFVSMAKWIPNPRMLSVDEAIAELVLRYFTSHGPATIRDLVGWSKLTIGDIKKGIAAAGKNLRAMELDDQTYWMAPGIEDRASALPTETAHALPGFDEYLLGYQDRTAVLASAYSQLVCPGNNGIFMPTIVVNGRVLGIWKQAKKRGGLVVTPSPFAKKLSRAESVAFTAAVERLGAFYGLSASVA